MSIGMLGKEQRRLRLQVDHGKGEKNTSHGSERFKDGCRASLVFLNLYRESGCQPTSDLAFKLAPRCSNLAEREIDSVSSCAINLDWDFNIGKQRQHTIRWCSGNAKFRSTTRRCTVQTAGTTRYNAAADGRNRRLSLVFL